MKQYLIIGQGDIGRPVAHLLTTQGQQVTTIARTPKAPMTGVRFWQRDALTLTTAELESFSHIAIIITPDDNPDRTQAYQDSYLALCQHLANTKNIASLTQILFVSSTAVYGENGGETIDEHTPARPITPTACVLRQAEESLEHAFGDKCTIVRPSGIYGKARTRMLRLAKHAHTDGVPSHHYTNRIMDSDLIHVIVQILTLDNFKPIYLASDLCPVPSSQVLSFICQQQNYPPPQIHPAPLTGKQIIANIDHDWLEFSDYQKGYAHILDCQ